MVTRRSYCDSMIFGASRRCARRDPLWGEWWPQNVDDVLKLANAFGTLENQHFRQVFSFWEMASSLVHRGALNGDLFDDWAAELYFCFAKLKPHLKQLREAMDDREHTPTWSASRSGRRNRQEKLKITEARVKN